LIEIQKNSTIDIVAYNTLLKAWSIISMMEKSGFPGDQYTVAIMMNALKKTQNPKDTEKALDLLDRSAVDVFSDGVLLNSVIETCIRHRQHKRLEAIIAKFIEPNVEASVRTYGLLIKACGALKQFEKCWGLWKIATEHHELTPSEHCLGCMLDALVCGGFVEEAVALLGNWKKLVPPNTVTLCALLKGFANTHQSTRAMELFREMKEANVKLDTFVFNVLLDSQARTGATHEVVALLQSMEAMGCAHDAVTGSIVIKAYVVKGDMDEALRVFRDMQNDNSASESAYNTMLDGCTRHDRMDIADLLLADMVNSGVRPTNFTLGIIVKMYGARNELHKAFEVLVDWSERYGLKPNTQVKNCILCACVKNRNIDLAYKVYGEIKSCGESIDVKSYNCLVHANIQLGRLQEAVDLVREAYGLGQPRGLPMHQTLQDDKLEKLMHALTRKKLMESLGMPLLESLRAAKVPSSSRLLSSIVNSDCCGKVSKGGAWR
jgi:pentatricopeptide repeat protein